MRTIDAQHIDEWLFDHFEGNLNDAEQRILTAFLNANPMLQADYDAWKNSYIQEPVVLYSKANKLLKKNGFAWKAYILAGSVILITALVLIHIRSSNEQPVQTNQKNSSKVIETAGSLQPTKENIQRPEKPAPPSLQEKTVSHNVQDSAGIPSIMIPLKSPSLSPDSFPQHSLMPLLMESPDSAGVKKDKKNKKAKKPLKIVKLTNSGF
jgi:hypothetical protein